MIRDPKTGALAHCEISAVSHRGLSITTAEGEPAMLAIVDKNGKVIEMGPDVAREAWNVSILSFRNFLKGEGYLRVSSGSKADLKR